MASSTRIQDINAQIHFLQSRKRKLEDRRKDQITTILARCGASNLPDDILAGALLEAVQAFTKNDSRIPQWQQAGLKILKPGRGKKKSIIGS
ncbi:conjugal transfer protein TraD [Candidatus Paracaedibacter symbiosus]|uniref:conjugal transfer protein TraD n=1 Tax=Candidatus Paracaedibacter symbiosus TaxID=244582 RepID=UPI000509EB70|nr:conjugal transfer protein TraD [Candidatus Paracaedibacter symbiosus]